MAKGKEKTKKPRKKRKGMGFLFSLIIILVAAGAVFWFGWVQFELEEGQVGVVYTKSHGYEEEALVSGEFAWRWQALLPTNLTIHTFNLETRTVNIGTEGILPSGELYASMAGDGVDFGWSLEAHIVYRITPESFPQLVADGLSEGDLDSWYAEYEAKLNGELKRLIASYPNQASGTSISESISELEESLTRKAEAIDSRVEVIEASIIDWRMPDFILYAESRLRYLELMGLRTAVLSEVEDNAVRREDILGTRLNLLERYGRVLDAYPVLLDLFALDGNPGASLLPPIDLE